MKAKKLNSARSKFVAAAERFLKRSLSEIESKKLRGFDDSVVETAIEIFEPKEIARMLTDDDGSDTVAVLEELASGRYSFASGQAKLLDSVNPKARKVMSAFDWDAELVALSDWFTSVLRNEPPPAKIRALNFGLFEADGGVKLYVTGANDYDPDDADWACANDWWPVGRYASSDALSKLYKRLPPTKTEPWVVVQAVVILLIKECLESHHAAVKKLIGRKKLIIATGFDDGDLHVIDTPLNSKRRPRQT